MITQVIYDLEGTIYSLKTVEKEPVSPVGIPNMNVVIPEGMRIKYVNGKGVDVSKKPHELMLEEIPKGEKEMINQTLEETRLALIELADVILGGM